MQPKPELNDEKFLTVIVYSFTLLLCSAMVFGSVYIMGITEHNEVCVVKLK